MGKDGFGELLDRILGCTSVASAVHIILRGDCPASQSMFLGGLCDPCEAHEATRVMQAL